MIVIENDRPPQATDKLLAAMFEARKNVFVDLLGWDVPVLEQRFEIDQFDDQHATYIILSGCRRLDIALPPDCLGRRGRTSSTACFPIFAPDPFLPGRTCSKSRASAYRRLGAVARRRSSQPAGQCAGRPCTGAPVRTFTGVAEIGMASANPVVRLGLPARSAFQRQCNGLANRRARHRHR